MSALADNRGVQFPAVRRDIPGQLLSQKAARGFSQSDTVMTVAGAILTGIRQGLNVTTARDLPPGLNAQKLPSHLRFAVPQFNHWLGWALAG